MRYFVYWFQRGVLRRNINHTLVSNGVAKVKDYSELEPGILHYSEYSMVIMGMLTTFPQCNSSLQFPEILSENLTCYHWLSVYENSKKMRYGILLTMHYSHWSTLIINLGAKSVLAWRLIPIFVYIRNCLPFVYEQTISHIYSNAAVLMHRKLCPHYVIKNKIGFDQKCRDNNTIDYSNWSSRDALKSIKAIDMPSYWISLWSNRFLSELV